MHVMGLGPAHKLVFKLQTGTFQLSTNVIAHFVLKSCFNFVCAVQSTLFAWTHFELLVQVFHGFQSEHIFFTFPKRPNGYPHLGESELKSSVMDTKLERLSGLNCASTQVGIQS